MYLELFKVKTIAPLYKVLFKRLMRQKFPCCLEQNFHLTHVNKPLYLSTTRIKRDFISHSQISLSLRSQDQSDSRSFKYCQARVLVPVRSQSSPGLIIVKIGSMSNIKNIYMSISRSSIIRKRSQRTRADVKISLHHHPPTHHQQLFKVATMSRFLIQDLVYS